MSGRSVKVTQIAFPESVNNAVHTGGVYASRGTNPMSNQSDGIFSDSLSSGYAATYRIAMRPGESRAIART